MKVDQEAKNVKIRGVVGDRRSIYEHPFDYYNRDNRGYYDKGDGREPFDEDNYGFRHKGKGYHKHGKYHGHVQEHHGSHHTTRRENEREEEI